MKKGGINNTFKKIIHQSPEMVFLVDNSSPYWIFYSNRAFEKQIGESLKEKNLAGLGLDVSSYLFKEELIIPFNEKYYLFKVEFPNENSDYFLFYNGKEIGTKGGADYNESQKFNNSPNDILAIATDNFFTWVNGSVKNVLGYSPDELINVELDHFLHPDEREAFKERLKEINSSGQDQIKIVHRFLTKNGDYSWVEWHVQVDEEKYYLIGRDINEFQELSQDLNFQNSLFDKIPEMVVLAGPTGDIIKANLEAASFFGVEESRLGDSLHAGLTSFFMDKKVWQDALINLEGTPDYKIEKVRLQNEGIEKSFDISLRKIPIEDSFNILLAFNEIKEEGKEDVLQKNVQFLKHLTDQVPGLLFQLVLDQEGKMNFPYLNTGSLNVFGSEKAFNEKDNDFNYFISKVHPKDIGKIVSSTVNSAKNLVPWKSQFRIKLGEGKGYRWMLGSAMPTELDNGEVHWYGYLSDIDEVKQFEKKLKKSKESAEKASKLKSEFISMISHEIRTPLNAISGSVYSLLNEPHSHPQEMALNTINFAVDNLIIMINDLLDFQKMEANKMELEKQPFNLKLLLNQVINGLQYQAQESKNNLHLVVSDRLDVEVLGDKIRLIQVINNLVTNALKFTNEGKVDVTATLVQENEEQVEVFIEVKDTGIGIAKENFEKVFNDFDQVNQTFSKKYGGTGLGMSITKKILERMGSEIKLESELGVGSTFYFELILGKAPGKGQLVDEALMPAPEEIQTSSENVQVLFAEDNDVNALVVGKIMKRWGYDCDRVNNGQEAVEAVDKKKYDLILMDIQMPVMDGFTASEIIKKKQDIPIIALTAASKAEVLNKIEKSGMERFLSKPIDAVELHQNIKELVNGKSYMS
ncbi:ATP-binding protein [Echinicola jeungdonensis]|uniref:histidine kinase n=1 Tax=Echinicola jeungdonensis TaxID=709343 RepID=A0ABV5J964_9BACT|nr:ATP-binding protein [Echinicola jeungdonensis]MDN3670279.1 ATP-binding protein [Echinicola jeungdonensis]